MKRLTKKRQDGSYVVINGEFHNIGEHINKLGQLEDIEEEIGIDLITLFKALKNGFWYHFSNDNNFFIYKKIDNYICVGNRNGEYYINHQSLKDYGKTWALTKQEIEDEKR